MIHENARPTLLFGGSPPAAILMLIEKLAITKFTKLWESFRIQNLDSKPWSPESLNPTQNVICWFNKSEWPKKRNQNFPFHWSDTCFYLMCHFFMFGKMFSEMHSLRERMLDLFLKGRQPFLVHTQRKTKTSFIEERCGHTGMNLDRNNAS